MSASKKQPLKKVRTFFDDAATLRPETKPADVHTEAEQKAPTEADSKPDTQSQPTPPKTPAKESSQVTDEVVHTEPKPDDTTVASASQTLPTAADFLASHSASATSDNTPTEPMAEVTQMPTVSKPSTPTTTKKAPAEKSEKTVNTANSTSLEDTLAADIADTNTSNIAATPVPAAEDDLDTGVIISNKKRSTFNPVAATASGIKQYWQKTKQRLKPKPKQSTRIKNSESRLETLQSAAKGSYHAPQDDYVSLQKKVSEHSPEATEKTAPLQVKDKSATAAPSWSHTIDSPAQPTEATKTDVVTQETTPIAKPDTTPIEKPLAETESSDSLTPAKTPTQTDVSRSEAVPTTAAKASQTTDATTEEAAEHPNAKESEPRTTTTEQPVTKPKSSAAPSATEPTRTDVSRTNQDNRATATLKKPSPSASSSTPSTVSRILRSRYTGIAIVFIALSLGTGTAIYWFGNTTPANDVPSYSIPTIVTTDTQVPVPLNPEGSSFLSTLAEKLTAYNTLVQFYPTASADSAAPTPATTAEIVAALAFRTPGNFSRNIDSLMFGNTANAEPFLIFKVRDFDTAFAGMLSWEQYMSTDLEPWFGSVVSQTFDESARTDTQLRPAFFTDSAIANISVRILRDQNQRERIVYGFVSPNIILVTTTGDAFRDVRERI